MIDEPVLRMSIEKVLSAIEHVHAFTRAVSIGNPREFLQAEKEDQEMAEACKRLIKNCIICWNYLYLSQKLAEIDDPAKRKELLQAMAHGSAAAWGHLNLLGEYDLAALEQAANVCERRIMEQEKVPMAEKIVSLSDADASFIVKGGWNTVVGYRPQLARSGSGFVTALVLPRGNAADSRHLVAMVKEQIANTGVIPAMTSADDGYSSQEGREEVLGLGVKVVSISGAKGKKLIESQQWKSRPYRQARAERSAIESLVFTLKEGFEFGEMARRTQENVLAEMLEKVLAYNIFQIIRLRKKLSEPEEMERAAA